MFLQKLHARETPKFGQRKITSGIKPHRKSATPHLQVENQTASQVENRPCSYQREN
jgi:hypothetical protein